MTLKKVPPTLADAIIVDERGVQTRAGDLFTRPVVLVFIRHFG